MKNYCVLLFFLTLFCFVSISQNGGTHSSNCTFSQWSIDAYDYWFIDTKTQNFTIDNEVILFSSTTKLGQIVFTKSGIRLIKPQSLTNKQRRELHEIKEAKERGQQAEVFDYPEPFVHKMLFLNGNSDVQLIGDDACSHYSVFGQTKVSNYKTITYKNIYPNIDITFTLPKEGGLKYDITIHPGGNMQDVQLKHDESILGLEANGNLTISSEAFALADKAPTAKTSSSAEVAIDFVIENDIVSFSSEEYNSLETLIIDPWIYAAPDTILLGSPNDTVSLAFLFKDVNIDNFGNVYASTPNQSVAGVSVGVTVYGVFFASYRKIDANGNLIWVYFLPLSGENGFTDFSIDPSSGVSYFANSSTAGVISSSGMLTSLSDTMGVELWTVRYDPCYDTLIMGNGLPPQYHFQNSSFSTTIPPINVPYSPTVTGEFEELNVITMDPTGGSVYFIQNTYPDSVSILEPGRGRLMKVDYSQPGSGNAPAWNVSTYDTAHIETSSAEALACTQKFLYSYSGKNLVKWDKSTGAVLNALTLGSPFPYLTNLISSVTSGTLEPGIYYSGIGPQGIDVDLCGNVYIGRTNSIHVYDADLNLIGQFPTMSDSIVDIQIKGNQLTVGGYEYLETFDLVSLSFFGSVLNLSQAPDSCGSCTGIASLSLTSSTCSDLDSLNILWSNGQTTPTISGLCEGWYSVTLSGGCHQDQLTDSIYVSNNVLVCGLTLSIPADTICFGECIDLVASTSGVYIDPVTYKWDNGISDTDSNATVCPSVTTTYTVIAIDSAGQKDTTSVIITVLPQTVASFSANPSSGNVPLEVIFSNTSSNATNYAWFVDENFQGDSLPSYTFQTTGEYVVYLVAWQAEITCADTFALTILAVNNLILQVPNVYTPNGDNVNDQFGITVSCPVQADLTILNRWQNEVFSFSGNLQPGFNGLWDGKNCHDGTYFYTLRISKNEHTPIVQELENTDFIEKTGFITLVR